MSERRLVGDQVPAFTRSYDVTTNSLPQAKTEHPPATIHVVPLDIDDERALALLERYREAIAEGEHPPYWYIGKVFSELYAIGMARRAEEVS